MAGAIIEAGVAENVDAVVEGIFEIAGAFEDAFAGVPDAEFGGLAVVVGVGGVVGHGWVLEVA